MRFLSYSMFSETLRIWTEENEPVLKLGIIKCTFAFSMQGQMAQAALAWTSGLGFFSKDQRRRTPSSWSMILREKNNNLSLLDTEMSHQAYNKLVYNAVYSVSSCIYSNMFICLFFPGFSLALAADYPSWCDDENIPVADHKAAQHGFPITSHLLSPLCWYPLLTFQTFQQLHSNMFTSACPKADPYNSFRRSVQIFIVNCGQTHTFTHTCTERNV